MRSRSLISHAPCRCIVRPYRTSSKHSNARKDDMKLSLLPEYGKFISKRVGGVKYSDIRSISESMPSPVIVDIFTTAEHSIHSDNTFSSRYRPGPTSILLRIRITLSGDRSGYNIFLEVSIFLLISSLVSEESTVNNTRSAVNISSMVFLNASITKVGRSSRNPIVSVIRTVRPMFFIFLVVVDRVENILSSTKTVSPVRAFKSADLPAFV